MLRREEAGSECARHRDAADAVLAILMIRLRVRVGLSCPSRSQFLRLGDSEQDGKERSVAQVECEANCAAAECARPHAVPIA